MIWFKHYSSTSNEEKITRLEDAHGLIGYALYFKILEMCASNWDEISPPNFQFPLKKITKSFLIRSGTVLKVLRTCNELELFSLKECNDDVLIYFPKLLELRKRYQKRDVAETSQRQHCDNSATTIIRR